jgi:hypothetical protein
MVINVYTICTGPLSVQAQYSRLFIMHNDLESKVKVKVTLRLTDSQSVSLGVEPHLGLMTRYLLFFDNYSLAFVGRPL